MLVDCSLTRLDTSRVAVERLRKVTDILRLLGVPQGGPDVEGDPLNEVESFFWRADQKLVTDQKRVSAAPAAEKRARPRDMAPQ